MIHRVWTGLPAALAAASLVASAAAAQNGNLIDNPQLRDFRLRPTPRPDGLPQSQPPIVITPAPPVSQPQATPAPTPAPSAQTPSQNQAAAQAREAARTRPTPTAPAGRPAAPNAAPVSAAPPPPAQSQPAPSTAEPVAPLEPVPVAPAPPTAPSPPPAAGGFSWLYLLPVAALALLGFVLLRRRRAGEEADVYATEAVQAPVVAAPPVPPPPPAERPWIALTLQVSRASATLDETVVSFELEIANTGKVPARNLRVDVKMFNAGQEQDSEIGAFFRSAGRQSTKLSLPGIAAENSGVIRGDVTMKRDDMRAIVLEEKYLFIPMIAVNVLYDWDEDGSGQTSKCWVVGRELQQDPPAAKMGAFRVDQGPRIWRTVGQRPHSLERRV